MLNLETSKKKIILLLICMLALCSTISAVPLFTENPDSYMYNNYWDTGFVKGILSFGLSLYNFRGLAQKLCIFLFFLNICWHSFKLWFGAIEIKKVAIDILYKFLLVTALMTVYPNVVDGVLSVSSNIGMTYSNSTGELCRELSIIYEECYVTSAQAMTQITKIIESGEVKKLSKQDINKLANVMQMKPEELQEKLEKANPNFKNSWTNKTGKTKLKTWQVLTAAVAGVGAGVAVVFAGPPVLLGAAVGAAAVAGAGGTALIFSGANTIWDAIGKNATQAKVREINQFLEDPDVENMMIIYKAFNDTFGQEVMTSAELKAMAEKGPDAKDGVKLSKENIIESRIASFITNLYLDIDYDSENSPKHFTTAIIAPSSMIRLAMMEAQVIRNKADIKVNKDIDGDGKSNFNFFTSDFLDFTKVGFLEISALLTKLLLPWILVIPVIYCVIAYIVCILEYYIVTSIGILLVPLLLFDPTKQYAAKLLHMFFSYFLKIMVITWVSMWCLANLLSTGRIVMCAGNSFSFQMLAFVLFQMIISLTISQAAPNIASVLLTGESRMGIGDVANVGRQMGHAMHMGSHMAHKAAHTAGQVGNGIQNGVKAYGAAHNAHQSSIARREAVKAAGKEFSQHMHDNASSIYKNSGMSKSQIDDDIEKKTKAFEKETKNTMRAEDRSARIAQNIYGQNINQSRNGPDIGGVGKLSKDGKNMNEIDIRDNAVERANEKLAEADKKMGIPDKQA